MAKNKVAPQKNDSSFGKSGGNTQKRDGLFKRPNLKQGKKFNKGNGDFFEKSDETEQKTRLGVKHAGANLCSIESADDRIVNPSKAGVNAGDIESDLKPARSGNSCKRPFDKKRYRLQKYSKKYKLEQWEDKRKRAVLRGYYKEIENEDDVKKLDVAKIYKEQDEEDAENDNNVNAKLKIEKDGQEDDSTVKKKAKPYKRAHLEFKRLKDEKHRKKEESLKAKEERVEALKTYRLKKLEKFKKLNKKTKKGQPIMKDRMEMLLEKIQQTVGSS